MTDDDGETRDSSEGQFRELAGLLSTTPGGAPAPERIVLAGAAAVPHAVACGLTLAPAGQRPRTVAATDDLPRRVDRLQYDVGEGPCLDAVTGDDVTLVPDLTAENVQWPRFALACVAETGVRSMLAVRLALSGDDSAALNFYAYEPRAFTETDVECALTLAPYAAAAEQIALHQRANEQLQTALASSRQIGIAVGILMERRRITRDEAFAQLSQASQRLNIKLRDLAERVGDTGVVPETP